MTGSAVPVLDVLKQKKICKKERGSGRGIPFFFIETRGVADFLRRLEASVQVFLSQ